MSSTEHYLQHPTPSGVPVKSESPIMMSTDQPLSQNVSCCVHFLKLRVLCTVGSSSY